MCEERQIKSNSLFCNPDKILKEDMVVNFPNKVISFFY